MAIAKVSVNQVVSMHVQEDALLRARDLALKNALLHVAEHVVQDAKENVEQLAEVVAQDHVITPVNLFQDENKKVTDFNSVITLLFEL